MVNGGHTTLARTSLIKSQMNFLLYILIYFLFDYGVNLMEYITHRYKLLLITYLQCNLYFTIIVLSIHDTHDIFT